jgi:AraC-like DNA-binding protein
MLTGGYGGNRYFSRNVMDTFMAPKKEDAANWGLGWWREGDFQRSWYFGTQSPSDTIGHQGWTGTLVMIDRQNDLVIVYLTNKINSPVTDPDTNPDTLARLLGTNRTYIYDALRECADQTPADFINSYRLHHATHLLSTTNDPVGLIAELCGLSRPTFYRLFNETYSMSPSDYRKVTKK